jgi:hypothetical protein
MKIFHKDARPWSGYGRGEVSTADQVWSPQSSNHTDTRKTMMLTKATWPNLFYLGQFVGFAGSPGSSQPTTSVASAPSLFWSDDTSKTEISHSMSISWEAISTWIIEDFEDRYVHVVLFLSNFARNLANSASVCAWHHFPFPLVMSLVQQPTMTISKIRFMISGTLLNLKLDTIKFLFSWSCPWGWQGILSVVCCAIYRLKGRD